MKKDSNQNESSLLNSPCTIAEAVQISRGVVDDAIADYHQNQGNVQLSMSLQIEILKELVFSSGMITEEEFRQRYMTKAKELQELQAKREAQVTASMNVKPGDIEVKVEE